MRIGRISVENFIGIRSVDLALTASVMLVTGPNGSGKSSLKDAVMFCALGQTARAPKLHKKDLADLLHPGAKRGHATFMIDGATYSRGLPTGNFSTASFDAPKGWEFLLDPGAFLRIGLEERRKELFRVLGIGMDVGSINDRLVERGHDQEHINRIRSFLRQGFAIAATECQGIAREAKGRWRQITGTDWGAVKAATWFAEAFDPELPMGDLPALRRQIAKLEGQLAKIDGQIGVARREQATAAQRVSKERLQKEQAVRVQRRIAELRTQLIGERAAKAECETAALGVEEAERVWEEAQAAVPASGAYTYTCGNCGRAAILVAKEGAFTGLAYQILIEPEDNGRADLRVAHVQAKRILADAECQLERFDRTRALLTELEAMEFAPLPAGSEGAPEEDLAEEESEHGEVEGDPLPLLTLEANRQTLTTQLQDARTAVRRVEDHQGRAAQAKQRTADAAALHAEIETWLRLAEDLGPEGIPAQLLHSAIDPINEVLARSGEALGFEALALTPEMDLMGRPTENDPETPRRYELLSESARWRAEAALAIAIGGCLEGSKASTLPVVLDRFDCLDGPNRSRAIRWLLSCGHQAIILGSLRNRDVPQDLPEGLEVRWLSAGTLATE